ncbi:MAG: hypothetical protein RIQ47_212 [Bacteroidota bacterium]
MDKKRVLITGASGMIAAKVAEELRKSGFQVVALSRSTMSDPRFEASYRWNPDKNEFDPRALDGVTAIVHLAGAGIADKKWTPNRKREILESRTRSSNFLAEQLRIIPHSVSTIVAASATGYYGNTGEVIVSEDQPAGKGFLADTCVAWEQSLHTLKSPSTRLTILRIGFVIDKNDGALPVMSRPVQWMVGAPYGSGKQFISWIDSHDLARLFVYAIDNIAMIGTYNAVAPAPTRNCDFVKAIGKTLHRPVWPIAIPSLIFKTLLGEQSVLVLEGQRVSNDKIISGGFQFDYPTLEKSLHHHLR